MPHDSQVAGFYAPPQLDLSLVLQSCKVYEAESGNQDYASVSSGCLSRRHVVSRRITTLTASERNAYPKGAFMLKTQTDNKSYGCPRCGHCFTVKDNMTWDYKNECGQEPHFQCPSCEFRIKQTSNVMKGAFMLKTQVDNKPHGCPRCGRGFTVKGNMTRHYKYECGQEPRFQCPYCEFRSKQTSNVMSHVRTKHPGCDVKYNYVSEPRSD